MQLSRAKHLLSIPRWQICQRLFRDGWQAHVGLSFLRKDNNVHVTLRNGKTLGFSRREGDHRFWDWFLEGHALGLDFTSDGELDLRTDTCSLYLRPSTSDFFVFREIFIDDSYGIGRLPDSMDTVIDLGGNVGLFTCAVLPRARRVITVEPVAANLAQAAKNIQRSGGDTQDLLRYAMTGRSGDTVTIYTSRRWSGMCSLQSSHCRRFPQSGWETVPTLSLSDLWTTMRCDRVDLLKCDIEGAEFDVFLQAPLEILSQIQRVVMEVHLDETHPRSSLDALRACLESAGLRVECPSISDDRAHQTFLLHAVRT